MTITTHLHVIGQSGAVLTGSRCGLNGRREWGFRDLWSGGLGSGNICIDLLYKGTAAVR